MYGAPSQFDQDRAIQQAQNMLSDPLAPGPQDANDQQTLKDMQLRQIDQMQ